MKRLTLGIISVLTALFGLGFWNAVHGIGANWNMVFIVQAVLLFIVLCSGLLLLIMLENRWWGALLAGGILAISFCVLYGVSFFTVGASVVAVLAVLLAQKAIRIDQKQLISEKISAYTKRGARILVLAIAILGAGTVFSFTPTTILDNLGLTNTTLNYILSAAQKISGQQIAYFNPQLTARQFALLYFLDQAHAQGTLNAAEAVLPTNIKQRFSQEGITLNNFITQPNFAFQHQSELNSLVSVFESNPLYLEQEKAILAQVGITPENAPKPITAIVNSVLTQQLENIWPQYGFFITLLLAVAVFLLIQSFRVWLAAPAVLFSALIVSWLYKFKVLTIKSEMVEKKILAWKEGNL